MKYRRRYLPTVTAVQWMGDNLDEIRRIVSPRGVWATHDQAYIYSGNHTYIVASKGEFVVVNNNATLGAVTVHEEADFNLLYEPMEEG